MTRDDARSPTNIANNHGRIMSANPSASIAQDDPAPYVDETSFERPPTPIHLPPVLDILDSVVVAMLNVALLFEVVLVFSNTLARTLIGTPLMLLYSSI